MTLWLTYFLCYCVRKPLSIYKFYIESELHLSKYQLGLVDLALLLPYAGLQIVGASWWDRIKVENVVAFSLALAGLALMLLSVTYHFGLFCLLVAVSGAAQAPLWPAIIKVLHATLAHNESSLVSAIGLLGVAPFAGAAVSAFFVTFISDQYGWRHSTIWIFLACFLMAFICKMTIAQAPTNEGTVAVEKEEEIHLPQLLRIPGVTKILVSVTLLKFSRYVLYMWLPLLLSQGYGFSMVQAGFLSSWFYVGAALGGPGVSACLNHFRSSLVWTMALGASCCFLLLAFGPFLFAQGLGAPLLLIIGFCNCGPDSVICGATTLKLGNADGRACGVKVTSMVNGIASIGGIIEGPLVSYWLHYDHGWNVVVLALFLTSTLSALSFLSAQHTIDKITNSPQDKKHNSIV